MMTYRRVLEFLNLVDATIDYLKEDIELAELKMFSNIFNEDPELLVNVKQLGMEIHPSESIRLIFGTIEKNYELDIILSTNSMIIISDNSDGLL